MSASVMETIILGMVIVGVLVATRFVGAPERAAMLTMAGALERLLGSVVLPTSQGTAPRVPALPGGGVTIKPWLSLAALPAWHQLYQPLPDGSPDPQEWNDCGETCCAMLIAAVHGTPIEPGAIRQSLGGVNRSGLTTAQDLVTGCAYYNVAIIPRNAPVAAAWNALVAAANDARATIILGNWPSVNAPHWLLVAGVQGDALRINDPWTGTRGMLTHADFTSLYLGWFVEATGHLHYDMSGHPDPV